MTHFLHGHHINTKVGEMLCQFWVQNHVILIIRVNIWKKTGLLYLIQHTAKKRHQHVSFIKVLEFTQILLKTLNKP